MSRFAAILSGGIGERFWPASSPERPKQLLPLLDSRTMLRQTLERLLPLLPPGRILVVTSASLARAVASECPEMPEANVIAEPRPRNTAVAVGVAAVAALARGGREAVLAVLPADHAVRDETAFRAALERAFGAAEAGPWIVTLGIRPERAETGYGYITLGEPLTAGAFRVASFHEKPDAPRAEELLRGGKSVWNAGMFIATSRTLIAEIERHVPELGTLLERLAASGWPEKPDGERAFAELYERAPSVSFDQAVMERSSAGAVVPADIGWDDVGSWEALARMRERDASGNVVHGEARLAEAGDNILYADGGRITVIGASGLLVVRSGDEVLVCARERLPEIKPLLRKMNENLGEPA